jgi:hypothetical protein
MAENEYYIAKEPLFIGRSRAHNAGDQVPAKNVERHGWGDKVVKPGSAAAADVPGLFDPSSSDVPGVLAHLDKHAGDDAEVGRVLDAEAAGQARKGILAPHGRIDS